MSHHHYNLYAVTVVRIDGSTHVDTVNATDSGDALAQFEKLEERRHPHGIIAAGSITIEQLNIPTDEE